MPSQNLNPAVSDYHDIIQSIWRTRGPDAEKTLETLRTELQKEIQTGNFSSLESLPAYAALAFRGLLRITNLREIKRREEREDFEVCLKEATGKGWLQIKESVKPAWDDLRAKHPSCAWNIIVTIGKGDPIKQPFRDPERTRLEEMPPEPLI